MGPRSRPECLGLPAPPASAVPVVTPRNRPGRTHATLALVTVVTLCLAGGTVWDPVEPQVTDWLHAGELARVLLSGLPYGLLVFLILASHEMGHFVACRLYGIPATWPVFLPGIPPLGSFGAVIRIRGRIPHRRALFDVAAAGPIAGFAVALPVLVVGMLRAQPFVPPPEAVGTGGAVRLGEPVLLALLEGWLSPRGELAVNGWIGAGWVGMLVTSLNLFPVGQLDGGHAAYAISRRLHRGLAFLTLAGLLGVIAVQTIVLRQFPFYVVWFAILLWMRDRHPRLVDETVPLGPGRKAVACLLVLMFALSFIVVPLYVE